MPRKFDSQYNRDNSEDSRPVKFQRQQQRSQSGGRDKTDDMLSRKSARLVRNIASNVSWVNEVLVTLGFCRFSDRGEIWPTNDYLANYEGQLTNYVNDLGHKTKSLRSNSVELSKFSTRSDAERVKLLLLEKDFETNNNLLKTILQLLKHEIGRTQAYRRTNVAMQRLKQKGRLCEDFSMNEIFQNFEASKYVPVDKAVQTTTEESVKKYVNKMVEPIPITTDQTTTVEEMTDQQLEDDLLD